MSRQSLPERIVRWWASRRDGRAMRDQWAAGYRAGAAAGQRVTEPCPSWCTEHPELLDNATTHQTTVTVGAVSVEVERIDGTPGPADPDGPCIVLPDLQWVSGQDAHDYAEAMRQAAALVHPEGVTR